MKTSLLMFAALLLATGCTYWSKPGFTADQWRQDHAQCQLAGLGIPAGQPGARIGGPGQPLMDVGAQFSDLSRQESAKDLCLEAKGYYRVAR